MKIVVNGRFLLHKTTGVMRYAQEILFELDRIAQPGAIEMAIPPDITDPPTYKNIRVVRIGKMKNRCWEHISFPQYVRKQNAISLNLCNVSPLSSPGIVCIHDVKIKAHPEFFSKLFRLWYTILLHNETKRAKKIITVSEFSKHEIMKYYRIAEDRIVVIPNAWQHFARVEYDEETLGRFGLQKQQYYFAIGSLEPNKNLAWIAENAKKMPNRIFAVAGAIDSRVFADGMGFECPPNMKLIGYVGDSEAKTLMRDCRAFLFPSIYEGFGIPPLEAMSAGCARIIVSDIEVMHEIYGSSVEYITGSGLPESSDTENAAKAVVLDRYSWKKSAEMMKEMLDEIGRNNR